MERDKLVIENFICNWNGDFPDYELKPAYLKEPLAFMTALIQVFDRLGIDRSVLAECPEDNVNESVPYYRDLLPVINMTRVVNHLVSVMPQMAPINVTHFLQPTTMTSHSILLLLFNLMVFNEEKLRDIAPYVEELFAKSEEVNRLVETKHKLQVMLNEQAQEKALRAERLEKIDHNTKLVEEEVKDETAACNAEQQVVDEALKEHRQMEVLLDQKRTHRDAVQGEVERKKTLRVYDADDVKAQVEQATRDVQELEEKITSTQATLMQKEDSIKNLQTIKPSLDTANNLLREITKLSESLMDIECGDLESESQEGELEVLSTELFELRAAEGEARAALLELQARARAAHARRAHEKNTQQSALREAAEKFRKDSERCEKAAQRTEKIKQLTVQYEEEKALGMQEISNIHNSLHDELQSTQEMLMNQMVDLVKQVKEKQKKK